MNAEQLIREQFVEVAPGPWKIEGEERSAKELHLEVPEAEEPHSEVPGAARRGAEVSGTEEGKREESNFHAKRARLINFPRPGHLEPCIDVRIAPTLQLRAEESREMVVPARKLYLVPTPQHLPGEEVDSEYIPKPSPLAELPPLQETVSRYVLGVVEIWGGRRQPMQLARLSHRTVYSRILALAGAQREIPKIRRLYIQEPIEGVAETTVTLRFNDRVRSLALRFEGVDRRWLCTEFTLL